MTVRQDEQVRREAPSDHRGLGGRPLSIADIRVGVHCVEVMSDASLITRARMFELLLEADHSFEPLWRAFVEEWEDEREPPLYLALSSVARHLINQLGTGDTGKFDGVFEVVERWHLQGDAYVREAASVGLLEDLQNVNFHEGTAPAEFEPWLRSESKRWWERVDSFWARGEPLTDA